MKKWVDLQEYGVWNLEKTLITFDIPLLFVCKTPQRIRYLTLCINEETGEYLACKTNIRLLLAMLKDKCSMRSLFTNGVIQKCLYISYDFLKQSFYVQEKLCSDIPEEWLPDQGAVLGLHNDSIISYIAELENEPIKGRKKYRNERIISQSPKLNELYEKLLGERNKFLVMQDRKYIDERRSRQL